MEDRGVEIVHGHFVFDGLVSEFVSLSVRDPRFDSAPGHPHGKSIRIMVPSVLILRGWRSSELSSPNNQRFVEQVSLLEVL